MSWVAAASGALDEGLSLVDDLWFSEQEQAELDLKHDQIELGREELATRRELSEDRLRLGLFQGAQSTARTRTLALSAVAGAAVLVGGLALTFGGRS